MSKKILCKKLNKELPALSNPPMPGPKGIELMNSMHPTLFITQRSIS